MVSMHSCRLAWADLHATVDKMWVWLVWYGLTCGVADMETTWLKPSLLFFLPKCLNKRCITYRTAHNLLK